MVKKVNSNINNVEVGSLLDSQFDSLLKDVFRNARKIVIVDENTQEHCWPYLLTSFESLKDAELIVLPTGEENKSIEVCFQVWQALSEYQIKRGDVIINLGGGVVTDMGGFIASIYKRGLSFINIPTTLLSMVDASVGGKTGVNLSPWKNQLGTFTLPVYTFCDPIFLKTLDDKEILSGRAEMIKHGLISDRSYYDDVMSKFDPASSELLLKGIQLKSDIVDNDPKEKGERKKLNFGHTVGHAIEGYCTKNERKVTHGECVAWGMIIEANLSCEFYDLSKTDAEKIKNEITDLYGIPPIQSDEVDAIVELMGQDKKNTNSKLNFTFLKEIGLSEIDGEVSSEDMKKVLQNYIRTT
tara:strand:- start:39008 stop:40072 length:1065 start_codon:yes stop_codon:yes gene_type:complete